MENFIMYFKADWCEWCVKTLPIVESLNKENETRKFFIVDVEEAPQMGKDFNIERFPTFIFIKNGEEVRRETGGADRDRLEGYIRYLEH